MVLQDAKYVNAFIAASIIDDSVTMRMFYRNDFKAYPFKVSQPAAGVTTAEAFATQMLLFDKEVFGYNTFQVLDKRLFHTSTNYSDTAAAKIEIKINESQPGNGGNNLIYCNETSYTISYCTTPNAGECSGGCDHCGFPVCWLVTWTQEICTGGPGNGEGGGWPSAPPPGPGGTGGGPTGGGGGNCNVGGLIQEGFAPPNPCNPPGGGNPLPPVSVHLNWLKTNLDLTPNQVSFLIDNPLRADEVYNYLEEEMTPQRKQIAKDHIEKMRIDTEYLAFVQNHAVTGNPNKIWWEDINWLRQIHFTMPNNIFNFYMKVSRPENKKPEEFADKCAGLKEMALRCKTTNKEILGYITQDGKVIITDMGNSESVQLNLIKRNGGVYYYYPLSLGLPTNSYYNMIIDNDNERILIPVYGIVHTHPDDGGGIPIDNYHSRSQEDFENAEMFKEFSFITNYVIEPTKSNNTYKAGKFNHQIQPDNYLDVQTNLSLQQLCSYF